jgi:hypothetical protein
MALNLYFVKKAIALSSVSSGVVVGNRISPWISSGPVPTAQTNLVPPPSIPPKRSSILLLSADTRGWEGKMPNATSFNLQ